MTSSDLLLMRLNLELIERDRAQILASLQNISRAIDLMETYLDSLKAQLDGFKR